MSMERDWESEKAFVRRRHELRFSGTAGISQVKRRHEVRHAVRGQPG